MERIIKILDERKKEIQAKILLLKKPISLDCIVRNEKFEVQADDYFDCLLKLREIFEKRNWIILCNGSKKNVYPSPMSRDMGLGKKAYLLTIGKQAEDLVNIFDEAEMDEIGTVEEQKEYYENWLKSLGF